MSSVYCTIPNNPSSNQDGNLWFGSFVFKLKMHTNIHRRAPWMGCSTHYVCLSPLSIRITNLLVLCGVARKLFGICVKMKIAAHRCCEMNNWILNNNRTKTAQSVAAKVERRNKSRRKQGISNENYYGNDKRPCCAEPPVVFILKNAHALTK